MSMTKTGDQHLKSLQDGRCVYVNGNRISDVTTSKSYRNAARSIAGLYEFQSRPENLEAMTYEIPGGGKRVSRAWQLPRSYDDLVQRRKALTSWAELHQGFMGRSPDHVASTIAAMYMAQDVYERYPGGKAGNIREYYKYARDNDLYLSYVIIDPQGDRSKSTSTGGNADLAVSIVDEDAEGITIRGSKMLGTGAILSNEVLVTTLRPLAKGEEKYAFTAAVPINASGVKLMSRRSYEEASSSTFDYPLASQFDENDALLFFDDTKIPWERVFVHRDVDAQLAQWHVAPTHSYQNYQATIRLMVKLRFLVGLAKKITEAIGTIAFPQVREILGELSSEVSTIEAFVYGMEASGSHYGEYFMPNRDILYGAQVFSQRLYGRVIASIRELAGGGVLMLPSNVSDFANPEIADVIARTQYSATGNSVERVKLFKLAWDALGSEFASRHAQYEMFYSGPRMVTTGMAFRNFNWDRTTSMVDRMMQSYPSPELARSGSTSQHAAE
jgi:4-hydroxyphenylacetate 3-monooxygenase